MIDFSKVDIELLTVSEFYRLGKCGGGREEYPCSHDPVNLCLDEKRIYYRCNYHRFAYILTTRDIFLLKVHGKI